MTNSEKAYQDLCQLSRKAKILEGISHLLEWDQETCMPKAASPIRAEQLQTIAGLIHRQKTGKPFADALSKLVDLKTGSVKQGGLKPEQKAALKRWHKDYKMQTSLPSAFVEQFAKVTSEAHLVWDRAKKQNDFASFLPTLKKVIDLNKQKAEYFGYSDHPYDALLDIYEPEMTKKEVEKVFSSLKKSIMELLGRIQKAKQIDDSKLQLRYPPSLQLSFGNKLAKMIGYTDERGRLDLSTHPFSSASHPTDSRITTRIIPNLPISNIRSILHECGHAFYEMGLPELHYGTPLGESVSLGVHESQSRWWETRIGLSKGFWKFLMPHMKKHFKGKLDGIKLETLWKGVNKVEPSLIRVEADEVTYALHVILRFELEVALIEGSLSPKDLPEAWNQKMEELLGIAPKTDSQGCLQDIHWSMGAFGYFPTYALGNLYASQFFEAFEKAHPDWENLVEKGEFEFIKKWLTDNIHVHGRRYSSRELLKKVSGKAFTSEPFESYLNNKYSKIYIGSLPRKGQFRP
ncbi:Thermostable carboxypeptidase 1 [Waddlia chondrophila 2032/99]|uniref:Metal-dependent carboxypeptidase n=1 Tax=Waddlia chondrophila 2032/99 TaxID=765953 RepID=F8LC79_9BACT|nr:Thermostable carboxypeptidase 1 [Waddlia chondrophila 2032/99]